MESLMRRLKFDYGILRFSIRRHLRRYWRRFLRQLRIICFFLRKAEFRGL